MVMHSKVKELKTRQAGEYAQSSFVHLGKVIDYRIAITQDRTVEGYLAVWKEKDDRGTAPIKGAFTKSLNERGPKSQSKQKILFLWMHDMQNPIGQFVELEQDDYGLRFKAVIDEIPEGDRALAQIRSGTLNQFSYGFLYVWDKMEYDENTDTVYMYEVDLWEGSVVSYGSQKETFAIRSAEQLQAQLDDVAEELETLIKSLPRTKQMELRQLITRQNSLKQVKPDSLVRTLKPEQPDGLFEVGNYKLDLSKF
jgi:HK97 family phage prohead protease